MELVYLWVDGYKNIQKQGFNFSPRFECRYDEDRNELTIDEKKDYVSIFPDNINVTAIVGENGSGKSSILEAFADSLSENSFKWLDEEQYGKYIVIYKYKGKYFYLLKHINEEINITDNIKNKIQWITKNPNERLLTWHSDIFTLILQNEVKPKQIFHNDKQVVIEKIQADKNKIKKLIVTNLMQNPMFKKDSDKFFTPSKVQIIIKWNHLFNKKDDVTEYDIDVFKEIEDKTNQAKEDYKNKRYKDVFDKIIEICDMKKRKLKTPSLKKNIYSSGDDYIFNHFEAQKNYSCLSKVVVNLPIQEIHKAIIKQLDSFEKLTFTIEGIDRDIIDFIFDLPDYIFDIELKDENKTFEDLSFGERQLLSQLHFILHYATQKKSIQYEGVDHFEDDDGNEHEVDIDYEQKIKSMIILLDEFEIGLHPNWQKKAIFYIMDFLQNIKDVDFNLLFTSHSPFILSDLPKENVIFLKEGKQVDVDIDTFGANIHTLLSHGFFMENGLMGEFAKEKIDKAIKYLNQKKLDQKEIDYCEDIIFIIGEPILKRQLQKMLDSKRLYKVDDINQKIKDMEYELSILKKHQKKATTDELNNKAKRKYTQKKSDKNE